MRLWHKDLIPVLPRQQLMGQCRECCLIAKNVHDDKLNHLLVNKVNYYMPDHLYSYGVLVGEEMERRGFNINPEAFLKYFCDYGFLRQLPVKEIFYNWHNDRYFTQCFYNLQEKYDCGGISFDDYIKIKQLCSER